MHRRITHRNKRKPKRRNRNIIKKSHFPSTYAINPVFNRVFRFVGTSANQVQITGRCLLNLMLSGVSGSTAATNLVESIKINSLTAYQVVDTSGDSFVSMSLVWKGERSPDKIILATGNAIEPAFIRSRPPRFSLAGFWITNLNDDIDQVLYELDISQAGAILDVNVSFTLGTGATRTIVITNPGLTGVGYAHLDNAVAAGTVGINSYDIVGVQQFIVTTP